jgi:hypothetical protein
VVGEKDRPGKKIINRFLHNQWQVGNFFTQKQVKARGKGAFKLY